MNTHDLTDASRPPFDALLAQIADYTLDTARAGGSAEALDTARLCLMDTLGCGLLALSYPACTKLLGPGRARRDPARGRRAGPGNFL